jgi:hypothetical protein
LKEAEPGCLGAETWQRQPLGDWEAHEAHPHDLLVPFPAELMAMWPVSTRVNKPENDDASLRKTTMLRCSTQQLDSRTQRRAGGGTAGCMALRRA